VTTIRRHRPYRRPAVDRSYAEAANDTLADALAAFYTGLVERGVPEKRAFRLTSQYLFTLADRQAKT